MKNISVVAGGPVGFSGGKVMLKEKLEEDGWLFDFNNDNFSKLPNWIQDGIKERIKSGGDPLEVANEFFKSKFVGIEVQEIISSCLVPDSREESVSMSMA